ncbi:MAG: PKD domain-containing protein [Bacteroidota bacterium]
MGADLTYRSLGNNRYEITLTFYRDCVGIQVNFYDYVSVQSSCYPNILNVTMQLVNGTGQEITPLCPSAVSTCNGGTFTGIQQYVYRGIVTLPANCSDWTISYDLCCRNAAITTMPSPLTSNINVYATIDNTVTQNDQSPVFSNLPVPFVCLGQEFCFSHGAFDADGDSIVYELIPPRGQGGVPLTYSPGFSAQQPLTTSPAMTFNTETGDLCFTPQMMEVTVMAVLVKEYRNGVLIGTVERDIQVTVINCTNVLPQASGINGTTDFSISACADQPLCFTINSSDTDISQNVTMDWDYSIPGATFSATSGSRPSATFCWTPTQADVGSSRCFTATVVDDACPYLGQQTYTYCIDVQGPLVNAGPDVNFGCSTVSTATLTAVASNGTAGVYSYQWSTGATTPSITAGPGNYVVSVTSGGCTSYDTVRVNNPQQPPAAAFTSNSPCLGSPVIFSNSTSSTSTIVQNRWDFGAGATASSANPSFTYSAAGAYTVSLTVTDANGCTSSVTRTVTVQPPPVVSISSPVAVCAGQSVTLTASGGSSYSWSPGALTGPSVSIIPFQSQSYQVVVTNANGCTATATVPVTVNPLPSAQVVTQPVLCAGSSNGSAIVQPSGGTPAYSYSWSTGGNGTSVSGLAAGSYSVTVTDASGCSASATYSIPSPTPIQLATSGVAPLCFGEASGSVSVVANGGTPGYSYSWSPGGGSTPSVNLLLAGNYSVTVTDNNGCTVTTSVSIASPAPLSLAGAATPSTCGASDGTVSVNVSGGAGGYQYVWSPGGAFTNTVSNLSAGNYSVIVTDQNGCSSTAVANIPSTNAPTFTPVVVQDVSCNAGADGAAQAGAIIGNAPFSYSWTNGAFSPSISGVPAGNYSVSVTDVNGCVSVETVTIIEPPALTLAIATTDPVCFGGSDGSASVTVNGGTPGYITQWSVTGVVGNTVSGLSAGSYTCTVTDVNGCTLSQQIQLNQPPQVSASAASLPVSCFGGSDGAAYLSSTANGVLPLSVSWTSQGVNGDTLNGVGAGTYQLSLTDANGCTASASTVVSQPSPLSVAVSGTDPSCFGYSDGTLLSSSSGGTPGYSFQWSTGGSTSATLSDLTRGTYAVMVTDANGCTGSATGQLNEPSSLSVIINSTPATCGLADGTSTASPSGGTTPYQYAWSSGSGSSSQATSLSSGSYTVTITDAHGCTLSGSTVISNIGAPQLAAATLQNVSCHAGSDGVAAPVSLIGNGPFAYSWSNGSTDDTLQGVTAGSYLLMLTDANGCQTADSVIITEPSSLVLSIIPIDATCYGASDGVANSFVTGGTPGYSYTWNGLNSIASSISGLSAGTYPVIITDANGCTVSTTFLIDQPLPILLTTAADSASCNGFADGSASVIVQNGVSPLAYGWSSTALNQSSISGLVAGTYSVLVTDAAGCTASSVVSVPEPSLLSVVVASSPVSCFGGSNGFVSAIPSGGTGGYTFSWSSGSTGSSAVTGLPVGPYSVIVTDINGCTVSAAITVQGPSALTLSTTATPATCGVADGTATASPSGGTAPYAYEWAPGQYTTQVATGLVAGGYGVIVTDANGCTQAASTQVANIGAPSFSAMTSSNVSCNGGNDGIIAVQSANGNGPFSFVWGNGASGDTAFGLSAGTYPVIMTDVNGCVATDTVQVVEPPLLVITATSQPVSCFGGSDGSANVVAVGGSPAYTFTWSSGSVHDSAISLSAGAYTTVVIDANGCTASAVIDVSQPTQIELAVSSTPALCNGSADGSAFVNGTGGSGFLQFDWFPVNSQTDTLSGLAAGVYTVMATDQNGCTLSDSVQVLQPDPLSLSLIADTVSCSGASDASVSAAVSGGVGGYLYDWSPIQGASNQLNGVSAGPYQVIVTDANGCSSSAATSVIDPAPLSLLVNTPSVICIGQSTTLYATSAGGTSPLTLSWSTGFSGDSLSVAPLVTSTYTVSLVDANGCSTAPQTVTVPVHPPLSVVVNDPAPICEGQDVLINSTAGGGNGGPYTYSWNDNSITTSSALVTPASDSMFTVTISDGCSPDVSAALHVVVNPLPDVQFTPQQFIGCSPVTVNLSNIHAVAGGSAYVWDLDETVSFDASPTHTYTSPGFYDIALTITTPEGCTDQDTVRNAVHVYGYPTALFQQSTESISVFTPSVELSDRSVDAVAWSWDFGDGATSFNDQNPTHVYSDSGTYTIRLIVTNEGGCPDTVYGVVRIEPQYTIFIPNAFTPNGDGRNDFFFPIGENIVSIEMWILDRWGLQIFHSTSFDLQWDGTYAGNERPCQNDVYEYVVDAVGIDKKKHRYIGHVSLVR